MSLSRVWLALAWLTAGCGGQTVEATPLPEPAAPGTIARKCDGGRLLEDLDPSCRRVEVKRTAATGMASAIEREGATDLDLCAAWSSGGPAPQSIALDFGGEPQAVTDVILVPEMTVDGKTRHVFEGSHDGESFTEIAVMEAQMKSGIAMTAELPGKPYRFLRIRTTDSPSHVAWREVIPLGCQ